MKNEIFFKNRGLIGFLLCLVITLTGCNTGNRADIPYNETIEDGFIFETANDSSKTFAQNLCVVSDKQDTGEESDFAADSVLIFDITDQKVIYASKVYEKLYPASVTKIVTAYVVLKYGNLSDTVTFSYDATHITEWGAKLCGFKEGDQVNLKDLLYAFLIFSGNDAGIALAEHISGSVEEFAELMNEEIYALGATNSHFVNPHGLHDDNHYTTTYDIYLIFNALIKDEIFIDIIQSKGCSLTYTTKDGEIKSTGFTSTNRYVTGKEKAPEQITVIGGKTGTTSKAGSCLVLYSQDNIKHEYISIVFKAADGNALFAQMTGLLKLIPEND